MKERLIIIVLAIVSGLIITTAAFFIYQSFTASSNHAEDLPEAAQSVPQTTGSLLLEVDEPAHESLTDKRSVTVRGTTNPENVIIVSSNQEDVSGKPSSDGKFSLTLDIDAGANVLIIRAVAPNGTEEQVERVVTYNTEEF